MNDFDGLLPPRRPAPPLPRRDSPKAIVVTARSRRRRKAAQLVSAGSALSIAFAGFAVLRPDAGTTGLVEAPMASRGPATAEPTAAATTAPSPAAGSADPSAAPGTAGPGAAPAGGQGGQPVGEPTPGVPGPSVPGQPPRPTPSAEDWRTYTSVRKEVVPDSGADCAVAQSGESATTMVCMRVTAPAEVPARHPADLAVELCAQVQEQRIKYESHQEAIVGISPADASDQDVFRAREAPNGLGAHELVIPSGKCVRYTFGWDGRDNAGDFLPLGDYEVYSLIPGTWTYAGTGDRAAMRVTAPGA